MDRPSTRPVAGSDGGKGPGSNEPAGRPTSRPSVGSSGRLTNKPISSDRYEPVVTPKPRSDSPGTGARPGSAAQVKPSNPGLTPRPRGSNLPVSKPQAVDRYEPTRATLGPRGGSRPRSDTRPAPRPNGSIAQPGTRTVTNTFVPGLGSRPRTSSSGLLHNATRGWSSGGYCGTRPYYGGSCYGPAWNPCRPVGYWNPWCSSAPSWCVGLSFGYGYGSSCWGWSSYYTWNGCWPGTRWWWNVGYCGWDPWWYRPCYTPIWWMPANYYGPVIYETTYVTTSYPSETATPAPVATSSSLPSDEPSFASARELTPEEQGRRYVEYGDYYFAEGRYRDAADAYGKARTLLPADASLHFVMADAEFALADYHFAAFLIGEGIRLEPGLARAENDKRLLYREPKDFEDQMAALRRYLEAKPYDAMAQLVLAYNLKFSLQPEKALVAFRRVLEIDPSNVAARTFVEALTTPLPGAEDTADAPAAVGGTIEIRDEM